MNKKINIKVCGKWILAGEYAVLKSYPALVFPFASQFIELAYQKGKTDHLIIADIERSFFESVLDQALQGISKNRLDIKGIIKINFRIVFGAGMGASAVICVLIGRLFHYLNWLKEEELFYFCHSLENSLHGQSSGVDIAAVLTGKPILYQYKKDNKQAPQIQVFQPLWRPFIFLSYSGKGGSTRVNIKKIKLFWEREPERADTLNRQMAQAVLKAKEGLTRDKDKGLISLIKAFSLAEECFSEWNLIGKDMKEHIVFLKQQGALAVKPTGSGSGGCVLSLWSQPPPAYLSNQLVSAF